jgi:hypothetical protein
VGQQPVTDPGISTAQQQEDDQCRDQNGATHLDAAAKLHGARRLAMSAARAALDEEACTGGEHGEGLGREQSPGEEHGRGSDRRHTFDGEKDDSSGHKKTRSPSHTAEKRHKKNKHKHEHRHERHGAPNRQLLDNAKAILSGEVLSLNVSTAEIMAVAAQLNKKSKKHREKKHKHGSSKHHKHRRQHSP